MNSSQISSCHPHLLRGKIWGGNEECQTKDLSGGPEALGLTREVRSHGCLWPRDPGPLRRRAMLINSSIPAS